MKAVSTYKIKATNWSDFYITVPGIDIVKALSIAQQTVNDNTKEGDTKNQITSVEYLNTSSLVEE